MNDILAQLQANAQGAPAPAAPAQPAAAPAQPAAAQPKLTEEQVDAMAAQYNVDPNTLRAQFGLPAKSTDPRPAEKKAPRKAKKSEFAKLKKPELVELAEKQAAEIEQLQAGGPAPAATSGEDFVILCRVLADSLEAAAKVLRG